VEVADIVRAQGGRFIGQSDWLSYQQLSVLRAITRCRTAALGGHIDQCSACGHQAISYNSCRNRHCPKCQAQARQRWIAAGEKELLDVPYFHVVFTIPNELNALCSRNAWILYDLLFRASSAAMLEVAANPKRLGAQIGFISILHTWGQNLLLHPHVHCVIPAGGFSADHQRWIRPKYTFFLPVAVLSVFSERSSSRGCVAPFGEGSSSSPAHFPNWPNPTDSLPSSIYSFVRSGSYTRNRRSGRPAACFATSVGTPIGSPSAITACWRLMANRLRFAGRTMRTAKSSGR